MRLIDADALSKLVGEPIEVFLRRLDLLLPPTVDAVEVVRCEDCRWGREVCGNIECSADSAYHGYEWFCANGERRENETD